LQDLEDNDIDVIILDHHEVEEVDFWSTEYHPHLYLINSQSPKYPNKDLSGAGVVYQFCRYVDKVTNNNYADHYLDLVALGLDGDMMSLKSFETRQLIFKGFDPDRIVNPFIYEMWQKNKFKLGDTPSAWGATFYIVPLVNAITRSGTIEEKQLIFDSMLKFHAFNQIPSNKRGHKVGETERVVDQAIRTCTNVKNRQTRAEDAGIELVEHLIEENHMMDHKVLLFLLEPNAIKAEIRGLIANKLMAKYQRPCCMLTKTINSEGVVSYQGSARGCDKVGVTEFKDICAATGACDYTVGHQGAFGLGIIMGKLDEFEGEVYGENIYQFIDKTDEMLKNMSSEPIYYVDYVWRAQEVDPAAILDIADMDKYWGKDMDEALVAIQGIQITKDMITMMASNTVKITLPHNVALIKFRMPNEEYEKLISENGYIEIDAICKCNKNEWNGNISPQLFLEDYEIVGECAYVF
jgi:single-stranded-DNA-specific exonuclease